MCNMKEEASQYEAAPNNTDVVCNNGKMMIENIVCIQNGIQNHRNWFCRRTLSER